MGAAGRAARRNRASRLNAPAMTFIIAIVLFVGLCGFLDVESARWLEALSLAWVVYSHRTGKTHHAFKLVGE